MKIMNRLFAFLSWMVIAVIVIYIAIAAPLIFGYKPLVVLSGSMEPAYSVGSIIYYHKCTFEALEEGDPITFKAGDSLVTHRVTTVNGLSRTVITKGDNNNTEDPVPVNENEILGKASNFSIPYAGYYITYGKHPLSILIMVTILLINYILERLAPEQETRGKRYGKKRE